MADDRIRMPSSQGGLVNFSGEQRSKWMLSPLHTIIMIVIVILFIIILNTFARGMLKL